MGWALATRKNLIKYGSPFVGMSGGSVIPHLNIGFIGAMGLLLDHRMVGLILDSNV